MAPPEATPPLPCLEALGVLSVGYAQRLGGRPNQEDRVFLSGGGEAAAGQGSSDEPVAPALVLAVFDGHGGDVASDLACKRLWNNIQDAAQRTEEEVLTTSPVPETQESVVVVEQCDPRVARVFQKGFDMMQKEMEEASEKWPRRVDKTGTWPSTAGTTATLARIDATSIAVAHVGDSRAVLVARGEFQPLLQSPQIVRSRAAARRAAELHEPSKDGPLTSPKRPRMATVSEKTAEPVDVEADSCTSVQRVGSPAQQRKVEPSAPDVASDVALSAASTAPSQRTPRRLRRQQAMQGMMCKLIKMTVDHKPCLLTETMRIVAAGGMVHECGRVGWVRQGPPAVVAEAAALDKAARESAENGRSIIGPMVPVDASGRVRGRLILGTSLVDVPFQDVSRSLGDVWSRHPLTGKFLVSPEPQVKQVLREEATEHFLFVVSDGVTKVMSDEQVATFIESMLVKCLSADTPVNAHAAGVAGHDTASQQLASRVCNALADHALAKWQAFQKRADNISVALAIFEQRKKDTPPSGLSASVSQSASPMSDPLA
eukprot:TRINITY_DN23904_c0_g1_i1.p1 TRINITY_DN23904_c0_g1~~TRINITY_DN23904_c0_g1_i1.p1  ORF type:complete len:544 (+),score=108.87 TRINITY_DN23904_c0_g1_i1:161-1792(+)